MTQDLEELIAHSKLPHECKLALLAVMSFPEEEIGIRTYMKRYATAEVSAYKLQHWALLMAEAGVIRGYKKGRRSHQLSIDEPTLRAYLKGYVMSTEPALELNELQREIIAGIRRKQHIIAARCGWGSGKTSSLIFALWFLSKTRPGTTSLLITDTNPRYNSVLMPEIQKWLAPRGWTYNHTLHKWTDNHTGSSVLCRSYYRPGTRSAEHNPLEGINVTSGVALIDECQTLGAEVAHKALGRLRSGPSPTLILVGLPVADAWWCQMAEQAKVAPLLFTSYVNQNNLSEAWFEATKLLPEAEREAMVMNKPKPPSGLVYQEFSSEDHVIDDFKYHPDMSGRIAIDWGFRKPSVLIIVYDEAREASVIVHEFNPQEVTITQLQ